MKAGRAQRWWFGLGVALLLAGLIASAPLALQAQGSAPDECGDGLHLPGSPAQERQSR